MPLMSKVDLFVAIRWDSRAGMSVRAMAGKYQVSRRTVRAVVVSEWPQPRKAMPPRASKLDLAEAGGRMALDLALDAGHRRGRHVGGHVGGVGHRLVQERLGGHDPVDHAEVLGLVRRERPGDSTAPPPRDTH